jgi:hypothetical protein
LKLYQFADIKDSIGIIKIKTMNRRFGELCL